LAFVVRHVLTDMSAGYGNMGTFPFDVYSGRGCRTAFGTAQWDKRKQRPPNYPRGHKQLACIHTTIPKTQELYAR